MSLESVKSFYKRLATDETFRAQLQRVESKDECSQFVKNAGYDFTTQEFEEYTAQLLDLSSDNDGMTDLDEKELEAVFGGASSIDEKKLEDVFGRVSPIFDFPIVQPMYGIVWRPIDIQPMYGIVVGDDLLKDDSPKFDPTTENE